MNTKISSESKTSIVKENLFETYKNFDIADEQVKKEWTLKLTKLLAGKKTRADTMMFLYKLSGKDESNGWDEFACDFLFDNRIKLLKNVDGKDPVYDAITMSAFCDAEVLYGIDVYDDPGKASVLRRLLKGVIFEKSELLRDYDVNSKLPIFLRLTCLVKIIQYGQQIGLPSITDWAKDAAMDLLMDDYKNTTAENITSIKKIEMYDVEHLMFSYEDAFTADDLVSIFAEKIGVSFDPNPPFIQDADKNKQEGKKMSYFGRYLWTVMSLEAHAIGSTAELQKRFGIEFFQRYPLDVLKTMYDERDMDKPYGLIIGAVHDDNSALDETEHLFGEPKSINQLATQLSEKGYSLRIIETGSKRNLGKSLLQLNKKYGEKHRISFGFFLGHGWKDGFSLGSTEKDQVTVDDIRNLKTENLRRLFIQKPTFISSGCSVGKEGGILQALSSRVDAITEGPSDDSYGIESVTVNWKDEKPLFSIVNKKSVPNNRYENGKKI